MICPYVFIFLLYMVFCSIYQYQQACTCVKLSHSQIMLDNGRRHKYKGVEINSSVDE